MMMKNQHLRRKMSRGRNNPMMWHIMLKEEKKSQSKQMTFMMRKRDPENENKMTKCLTKNAKKMKKVKDHPVVKSTSESSRPVR